jgi:cyclophilin family peptidyl-prolyl cis-trans isomerase
VREAALDAISRHAELNESARAALIDALSSPLPGIVATATDVLEAHPDRVMVLSAKEIRSALDPAAPPPGPHPSREIDPAAAKALASALARTWSLDLIETRVGLLDAAAAVRLPEARDALEKACHDANVTVREHALKDLRALGDASPTCSPEKSGPSADNGLPGAARPGRPVKVTFETDAGELVIVLEPELAPMATERFAALARQGFYRGTLFHRVVPGFVAQFGDPGGDGYGGSGSLLRCETSPVPFGPLDVGVALSGRDTGSSQLFVTLARYPHLDGDYARVGHAEGDWAAVAEGDVIRDVKVSD